MVWITVSNSQINSENENDIFFAIQSIKKLSSKVAHNPTRQPVFSPVSSCSVKLRQYFSLKFSHLSRCQTFEEYSISYTQSKGDSSSWTVWILKNLTKTWKIFLAEATFESDIVYEIRIFEIEKSIPR